MRLLFVGQMFPLPVNNGWRMRNWALLRALAAEGHQVDLIAPAASGQMDAHSSELARVCRRTLTVPHQAANWSQNSNVAGRLRSLFSPEPYGVTRFRSPLIAQRIQACLAEERYDALVSSPFSLVNVPRGLGVPLILDAHNVEHLLLKRYLDGERNPVRWAYAWLEWRKLAAWEADCVSRACLLTACSEVDRATMCRMCPSTPGAIIPNVVDIENYATGQEGEPGRLLYTGVLDWLPNRNAVEFFIEDILPELRKLCTGFRFTVPYCDHAPPAGYIDRFAGISDVEFLKTPDIRAEIARASVFVVPIRIGSGTRLKILEAAALSKPVVSTRVGAEGLNFADGAEILLEDEPAAFARAVAGLLASEPRRREMGAAARARVEREYSFDALQDALRIALARIEKTGVT